MASKLNREAEYLNALFSLTLNPAQAGRAVSLVESLTPVERSEFVSLADSHHVLVRGLKTVLDHATRDGNTVLAGWASEELEKEHKRISTALVYLQNICEELESANCPTTVMKSLDHWPDLGNDLDLYSTASEAKVVEVFTTKLRAEVENRRSGDWEIQRAYRAAQLGRSAGSQMELCRAWIERIRRNPRPTARTNGRAHRDGSPFCDSPRAQGRRR